MGKPILEAIGVSKAFGALQASDQVSLDVVPGEVHALIGPNGAGKSTLIQLLCGGLPPDAGRVQMLGEDVTGLGPAERARRGLGRSFQISSVILGFSVMENAVLAAMGARGKARGLWAPVMADAGLRKIAEAAVEAVGLSDRAAERASDIAHGERRRLELAMALAMDPKVLVLDEPMAGLGPEGTQQMTALLQKVRRSVPILLVEHDMDVVFSLADRVSVLVYGRIIASGDVGTIRSDPEVQSAYLGEGGP